jgi:hypothetical protein
MHNEEPKAPMHDDELYDRLEAEADNHAPTSENMPTAHRRYIFSAWYAGWDMCAEVAARISAERQPVPVSDEELARIYDEAKYQYGRDESKGHVDSHIAGIRAVRAALGPAVPVIPGGWQVDHAACCLTRVADQRDIHRTGSNWMAALTAAIEAAKEATND